MPTPQTRSHLPEAQSYAAQGAPVLPLHTPTAGGCSCRRAECDKPGKHPRHHKVQLPHGLHSASTDPAMIATWWSRWPSANLGMRTGVIFDVVDVDSDEGLAALQDLLGGVKLGGPLAQSGGGGWHLYVAATGFGNRVKLLPGVDYRGANGQITAPPSLHTSGLRYRWCRELGTVPLPDCPDPLLKLLCPPPAPIITTSAAVRDLSKYAQSALDSEAERVAKAEKGTRNHALNKAAYNLGRLVGGDVLDERDVITALTGAAQQAKLGHLETARTIGSGLRAGRTRPRTPQQRG